MALDAAEAVRGRDVQEVVASSLQRAQETAAPLAEVFGLPVTTDDRLLESTNHFEGKTFGVGDGALRHPSNWPFLVNPFQPSWGEPYQVVAARMLAAVRDVRDRVRGHEAVCVSHQLPDLDGAPLRRGPPPVAPARPPALRARDASPAWSSAATSSSGSTTASPRASRAAVPASAPDRGRRPAGPAGRCCGPSSARTSRSCTSGASDPATWGLTSAAPWAPTTTGRRPAALRRRRARQAHRHGRPVRRRGRGRAGRQRRAVGRSTPCRAPATSASASARTPAAGAGAAMPAGCCSSTRSGCAACTGCSSRSWPTTRRRSGRTRRPGSCTRAGGASRAWVDGAFVDELVMSVLEPEWRVAR